MSGPLERSDRLPLSEGVVKGDPFGGKGIPLHVPPPWTDLGQDCWWPECWWNRLTGYTCIHQHETQRHIRNKLPVKVAWRLGMGRRWQRRWK